MKIAFGSDHGGLELKNIIMDYIKTLGYDTLDCGTYTNDSVDYADYAKKVADEVVLKKADLGMLFCGTGIGISIAANKVDGIRCALIYDEFSAQMAKLHNDANIIALGGRTMEKEKAKKMVKIFLDEIFEGGRHSKRLEKIHNLEKEYL